MRSECDLAHKFGIVQTNQAVHTRLSVAVELEFVLISVGHGVAFLLDLLDGEEILAAACGIRKPVLLILVNLENKRSGAEALTGRKDDREGGGTQLSMFEDDSRLGIHSYHNILPFK